MARRARGRRGTRDRVDKRERRERVARAMDWAWLNESGAARQCRFWERGVWRQICTRALKLALTSCTAAAMRYMLRWPWLRAISVLSHDGRDLPGGDSA